MCILHDYPFSIWSKDPRRVDSAPSTVSRSQGQRVNQRRVRLRPLGSSRSPKGLVNIGRPTSGCRCAKRCASPRWRCMVDTFVLWYPQIGSDWTVETVFEAFSPTFPGIGSASDAFLECWPPLISQIPAMEPWFGLSGTRPLVSAHPGPCSRHFTTFWT